MAETFGTIQFESTCFDFKWTKRGPAKDAESREIYGWVVDSLGNIVDSCTGWYGTNDPLAAASMAEKLYWINTVA